MLCNREGFDICREQMKKKGIAVKNYNANLGNSRLNQF